MRAELFRLHAELEERHGWFVGRRRPCDAPADLHTPASAGQEEAPARRPSVSIVVNNYNYARYLGEAIDSALAQTYPHVEVVVVDDGSTDHSREVIAGYGERVLAVLKENGGQASAFNAGFAAARGEIVIFLDADDVLMPQTVERVVAAWRPGLAQVQYRLQFIDASGNPIEGSHPHASYRMPSGDVTPEILARGEYICSPTSGNAFSREALAAILPVPAEQWRLSADAYLVYLTPFHGPVVSLEEPLGYYRVHGQNNWTHGQPDLQRLAFIVQTDLQRQAIVLEAARRKNLPTSREPLLNSPWHVYARIMLLLLGGNSPAETYSLSRLAWRGLRATWSYPRATVRLKVAMMLWLAMLPLAPRPLARRLALWRVYPTQRPRLLRKLAELVN